MAVASFVQLAGIGEVRDRPGSLFRLLVACILAGSPVRPERAAAAARAVFEAGWTSADRLARATLQRRISVLSRAGYPRFVGRAAASLGEAARLLAQTYGGDLRRLRAEAGGDRDELARLLRRFPGIGQVGALIFCAEVSGAWPEAAAPVRARASAHRARSRTPAL